MQMKGKKTRNGKIEHFLDKDEVNLFVITSILSSAVVATHGWAINDELLYNSSAVSRGTTVAVESRKKECSISEAMVCDEK